MIVGMIAYLIGLWNAQMQLNEKGSLVAVQKNVRDLALLEPAACRLFSWLRRTHR
jgi:uncharacterized membrane protein YiaA